MRDLKSKTLRGGFARLLAQATNFVVRLGTLMILARLLEPKDFGLVGMVTALTGVLSLFRDFGLSSAVVQRSAITDEQVSTLFWLNQLIGLALAVVSLALAPVVAKFYDEPRLISITAVVGIAFVFNAIGMQHGSLLQREMRFGSLAVINSFALIVAGCAAVAAAILGMGYWALVVMTLVLPLIVSIGCWLASGWVPGRPRRDAGINSMVRFGGALTLNSLAMYAVTNVDKVLVGRYCGVDALGIYGRAYQLVSIPIDNLNSAAGEVAFAALSRIQDNAELHKRYFLKGYSLVLAMTVPITIGCALLASDLVAVILGPKWAATVPIFRLLAPTILAFAIVNPLGWLIYSLGMVRRALLMSLVLAPVMIASYVLGLRFGPQGVAFAYSLVMLLWAVPAIAWAVRGTALSVAEVLLTAGRPLAAGAIAGLFTVVVGRFCAELAPLIRLLVQTSFLLVCYGAVLVFATGQKSFYMDIVRGLRS